MGAIHDTGLDAPGREDFTTEPQGLKQFQIIFDAAVENQEWLRNTEAKKKEGYLAREIFVRSKLAVYCFDG